MVSHMIDTTLIQYIEEAILPRYDHHDAAHRRDHALSVIERSLTFAERYGADRAMAYTIAAYHDIGLVDGREHHHTASKRILLADARLREWFCEEQIATMGDAVEDHRASADHAPRTIYGAIVAEADRMIIPEVIIRRTIQYTLANHSTLNSEEGYERMIEHLNEKYNYGGYLRLWLEESDNAAQLEALRQIIADKAQLRAIYDTIYAEEIAKQRDDK